MRGPDVTTKAGARLRAQGCMPERMDRATARHEQFAKQSANDAPLVTLVRVFHIIIKAKQVE